MLENPRLGFSQGKHFIFIEKSRISNTPLRKPATRVFQHFSFRRHDHAEPIRRSVVTRPKVKRAEQEKCDSREFAEACKPKACVPPQMGFAHLGLFAVKYFRYPHPTNLFPTGLKNPKYIWTHFSQNPGKIFKTYL
ncbi:hypothetical protein ASJ83_08190 [Methanocorpusculum parvum]|uniref:Uncharacterized protein n=1 Tax=Methanocorpusculum parvum TaxID=2193 RepID=A0AAX0Q8F5_9EURY|nr:hypothetical protein ASJ83_08190 [Methanocorpusculum parvum]